MEHPDQGKEDLRLSVLSPVLAAALFETLLYGVYLVLFGTCIFLLVRRGRSSQWVLLVFITLLFAIATADIAYKFYFLFEKILRLELTDWGASPKLILYVTNNLVADTLLIYRCYVIWRSNVYVIIGPVIVLVLGTVCGYMAQGTAQPQVWYAWVYLVINFVLNVAITGLAVGRIWWVHRAAGLLLDKSVARRYKIATYIFIESGAIYSVYMILLLIAEKIHSLPTFTLLLIGLVQFAGIMPTLIVVRSELTRSVEPTIVSSTPDHQTIQHREGGGQLGLAPGIVGEDGAADHGARASAGAAVG